MSSLASLFVLLVFALTPLQAHANVSLSSKDTATISLAPHLEILEDSSRRLNFEDVQRQNSFRRNGSEHPIPGYTTSAWWVRFSLQNPTTITLERFIEYADSGEGIPTISAFVQNSLDKTVSRFEMGGNLRHSEKTWDHRNGVLPLSIPPQSTSTIFIRAEGDSIKIPLLLHTPSSFYASISLPMMWMGIVYGFLLVILIWNLTIFVSTKDRGYFYYAIFVAGLALVLASFDGLSGQYLFPNSRYLFTHSVNVASSLAIGFLLLFTHEFLNLKNHKSPIWNSARYTALWAFAVASLSLFWKHNALVNITVSFGALLCLFLAVRASVLRLDFSVVFPIPIAAFLLTVIVTALKQAGVLPSSFFTEEALRFGAMISALFWTLALAYRFRKNMYLQHASQKSALELDIAKQKTHVDGLQALNTLVVDISDKLNSPLLVVQRVFERLQEQSLDIENTEQHAEQTESNKNASSFFNQLKQSSFKISESIKRLAELSQELSERREESVQREARKGTTSS